MIAKSIFSLTPMQGKPNPISDLQTGERWQNMDWIFLSHYPALFISYDACFRLGPLSHFADAPTHSQEELDEIPELEPIEEDEFRTRRVRSKL